MTLRGKLKRLEESIGGTAANKDEEEEARKRAADEKRARIIAQLEHVIAESDEPKPELSPEEEAEIEAMWEATWGHLKHNG